MLLVGAIILLLLMLLWCRRKEREGMDNMSKSCGLLADEQSNSMDPVPFCANGSINQSATKCRAMRSGKCKRPFKYPICPGSLEFKDGKCV